MLRTLRARFKPSPVTKQRGQSLIMFAAGLVMLLGMVGLAIDGGRAYVVSAQLAKALDAGVLAGAKASAKPEDLEGIVKRVFAANFPEGYMGVSTVPAITRLTVNRSDLEPNPPYYALRSITATAQVNLPTTFMRVLAIPNMLIVKNAASVRRVMDIILVIDRSASIGQAAINQFLKPAIVDFLNLFNEYEDRVGVLTFAGSVSWLGERPRREGGFDRSALVAEVNNITAGGWTASGPAMREALAEMLAMEETSAGSNRWRIILFFTDGTPNVIWINPNDPRIGGMSPCLDYQQTSQLKCDTFSPTCLGARNDIAFEGAHLAAGEQDNPDYGARQYIFGLFRHYSGTDAERSNVPFLENGFKGEESPGCDPDTQPCNPQGSLILAHRTLYRARGPLVPPGGWCADPRQIIEPQPSGRRLTATPVPGEELPLMAWHAPPPGESDVPEISLNRQLGPPLVSARDVAFALPPAGIARWQELRRKINGMARNYLENVAHAIRGQDPQITIYTIGLNGAAGQMLRFNEEWEEYGQDICKRVANVPEARGYYNESQPRGLFVLASVPEEISDAFTRVANSILRLSR